MGSACGTSNLCADCSSLVKRDWDAPSQGRMVIANIYDLNTYCQPANRMFYDALQVGGAFHAGIHVFGAEWSYGRGGVYSIPPRKNDYHVYRQSIPLGETDIDPHSWAAILHEQMLVWRDNQYNPLQHNCVDFTSAMADILGVTPLPHWIGRIAKVGAGLGDNLEKVKHFRNRAVSFVGHRIEDVPVLDKLVKQVWDIPEEPHRVSVRNSCRVSRASLGIVPEVEARQSSVYGADMEKPGYIAGLGRLNKLVHPLCEGDEVIGYALEVPAKKRLRASTEHSPEDGDDFNERIARQSQMRVSRKRESLRESRNVNDDDDEEEYDNAVVCLQNTETGDIIQSLFQYEDEKEGLFDWPAPAVFISPSDEAHFWEQHQQQVTSA